MRRLVNPQLAVAQFAGACTGNGAPYACCTGAGAGATCAGMPATTGTLTAGTASTILALAVFGP